MNDQSSDYGYGQMTPDDITSDAALMAFFVRQGLGIVDTVKVVKVLAVHLDNGTPPAGATVDVQPLVNQIDGNGNATPHGTVNGIPVIRLQAGPWAIIADPAKGDIGLIVCADRDSSVVVKNKAQASPGSRRRHNIADGFYIGGILNPAPTAYVQLKSDGTLNITDSKGNVLQTSSSGFSLTGNLKVTGTLEATGTITADGAIHATGAVIAGFGGADQVGLQTHTQSGVTTGAGVSGPPTPGT